MHQLALAISALLLAAASAQVLVDFQVAEPPPVPTSAKQCEITLFEHTFGNSYYSPAIVNYIPPTDCGTPGSWAGVTLNFTVTSNGTQYDRLGVFTFQNVEIWRTSTPEPTQDGIIWNYQKDVTRYIPLFAKNGSLILELDNILTSSLTGEYATTLQAVFYEASLEYPTAEQSNVIIPISTLSNTLSDDASVPPSFSLNVTVPQNAVQIYAEVFASGNGEEEFWYSNAANEYMTELVNVTYGNGPFREVRLLVDGQLAGVAFPYPVVFTGGVTPTMWRPITSYGALDLPTYFLDLTPFVPLLTDSEPHNFTLDVASAEIDHAINPNWYVSALLQVVTDSSDKRTTGKITSYSAPLYATTSTTGSTAANGDVNITVKATHNVHIEAEVVSGSGKTTQVVWQQSLSYENIQNWLTNYTVQNVYQTSSGSVSSTHNGATVVQDKFSYPFTLIFDYLNTTFESWYSEVDHSYNRQLLPAPFILGSTVANHQTAAGYFFLTDSGNYGNGTNSNTFSYTDTDGNTYWRNVNAAYDNITLDESGGSLASRTYPSSFPHFSETRVLEVVGARLPGKKQVGPSGQSL